MSSDPRGSLADELASSFGALGVAFDAGSLLVTEPVLEAAGPTPAPTPSPLASTPTAVPTPAPTAWPTVLPALAPSAALSPELSEEDEELVLATMSDIEDQEKKILDSVFGNVSAVDDRVDGDGVVTVKPARVKATAVGITSAVALDADAVNRSGAAAVEVSVEDGAAQAVRVQVPVEVIMQTAGSSEGDGAGVIVGISVTVMSAASRFPGMETASAQASIVLQRKDGEPLSGVELSKPVRIVLLPSKSEGLVCAWWDPASMKWSVYGVKEFVHDGAELICATNHLSIFTVLPHVVKTLGTALVCSNTKVFSAEVFQQATRDTGWLYGLHGLFYLSLVSVTVVLLMLSSYLDSRWRRRYKWTDSNFCTQNDTFRTEKVSIAKRVWEFVASLLDVSQISRSLTYHALAYEERFAARSIEVLVKGPLEADGRSSQGIARAFRRGGERVDEAVDNILEVAGQAVAATGRAVEVIRDSVTSRGSMRPAARLRRQRCVSFDVAREVPDLLSTKAVVLCDTFWGSRPWWRLWVIFLAVNKWIRWHHYSIYERSTTRCLLLTGHMWGAVLAIAVFSEQTGSSLSYGSDAECETEDFWEKLQMDIAVGFLSAVISSAPTGLAQMILLRRRFVYQSDWEVIQQESYSRCWRAQERTLIAMLWVYTCFCALFVWLFLASISAASREHTIASMISSVASNVLVNPLVVSLALLTVAAVHQRRDPDALNNIKGDMRKQFEVEAEEIVFDPISVPEDGRCCAEPDAEPDVLGDVPVSEWAPPLPPLPLPGCPDACEDDSLGIVFDLPYDQVRHDVFIGALRDGLRGMGVGENGLDKVHVALHERPAGGTVARLSGPVSVIVEIGVMNLAERLEVMAWRPSGTQPSAHRERDDGQLYDVLDGDRLVEAELRARLDAAEAHDQAMQRSLDSAIGLSLNSTGALTQVPRGCCARQIASFAGAVERLWLEKGQTLLQELRGNLRQAGGAMACWGSRAAELDAEPLELWTLGLVCRKARSAHAHRILNAEFQGHLLAVFCWLVGAMRGVDIDRLLGHQDGRQVPRLLGAQGLRALKEDLGAGRAPSQVAARNPEVMSAAGHAACACFDQAGDLDRAAALGVQGRAREALQQQAGDALGRMQPWVKWLCFLADSATQLDAPMTVTRTLRALPEQVVAQLRGKKAGDLLFWAAPVSATEGAGPDDSHCERREFGAVITVSGVTRAFPLFELCPRRQEREWLLPPFSVLRVGRVVGGAALRVECSSAGCALGQGLLRLARQDFTKSSRDLSRVLAEAERALAADERRLSETRRRAQPTAEAILRTAHRARAPSPAARPPPLLQIV